MPAHREEFFKSLKNLLNDPAALSPTMIEKNLHLPHSSFSELIGEVRRAAKVSLPGGGTFQLVFYKSGILAKKPKLQIIVPKQERLSWDSIASLVEMNFGPATFVPSAKIPKGKHVPYLADGPRQRKILFFFYNYKATPNGAMDGVMVEG